MTAQRKVRLTTHAKNRAGQFGFTIDHVYWMIYHSEEEPRPPGARQYEDQDVKYRRHETVVMTVKETTDKYTDEAIFLVITLFDQKMYFTPSQLVSEQ